MKILGVVSSQLLLLAVSAAVARGHLRNTARTTARDLEDDTNSTSVLFDEFEEFEDYNATSILFDEEEFNDDDVDDGNTTVIPVSEEENENGEEAPACACKGLGGALYCPGETYRAPDGCNTCVCDAGGSFGICTEMFCGSDPEVVAVEPPPEPQATAIDVVPEEEEETATEPPVVEEETVPPTTYFDSYHGDDD